jgi:hypothetical protein
MKYCSKHTCKHETCHAKTPSTEDFCPPHQPADSDDDYATNDYDLTADGVGPKPIQPYRISKFVAPEIQLGKLEHSTLGLPSFMRVDEKLIGKFLQMQEKAIKLEFEQKGTAKDKENLRQILDGTYLDDAGKYKTLAELLETPQAKTAQLKLHHVLALRVYTTSSFKCINNPLRKPRTTKATKAFKASDSTQLSVAEGEELTILKGLKPNGVEWAEEREGSFMVSVRNNQEKKKVGLVPYTHLLPPPKPKRHPFAATTYFISEGIKRLRTVKGKYGELEAAVFWRGMEDTAMSEEFQKVGGTEYGCLSTSERRTVAEEFAKVGKVKCPMIFKFVTESAMQRGADISFLSVYPSEKEVLYPPLTYLAPIPGKVRTKMIGGVEVLIVEVRPHFGT